MNLKDFALTKEEMKNVNGGWLANCNDPHGVWACNQSSTTHYDFSICCCVHTNTGVPV